MTIYGTNLIVAGQFTEIAGVQARGLAKWDGLTWSEFGGGAQFTHRYGTVYTLVADGSDLYAGGSFEAIGGVTAGVIARWTGDHWETLGAGVSHVVPDAAAVYALHKQGTNIYVGGSFTKAGEVTAFNIARWDRARWHPMGDGAFMPTDAEVPQYSPPGRVNAITGDGANIYVGGFFFRAGMSGATNLAKWNGSVWERIGNTSDGAQRYQWEGEPVSGFVHGLGWQDGALYVGGDFTRVNGLAITNIARWKNSSWDAPITVDGRVNIVLQKDTGVYVTGNFESATTNSVSFPATNIVKLTAGHWSAVDAPMSQWAGIYTVEHFKNTLFAGGLFGYVGTASAGNIGRNNGSGWLGLGRRQGNSLEGFGQSIATDGTNVYVTGSLSSAGTTDTHASIAHWNGTNWTALPELTGYAPPEIVVVGSKLYAAGHFTLAEVGATNVAVWDGQRWAGAGDPGAHYLFDNRFVVAQSRLYGSFTNATKWWDGQEWHDVPWATPQRWAERLGTDGTNVFIARTGVFGWDRADIARWDGTNLFEFPPADLSVVSAIGGSGTNVLVGGTRVGDAYLLAWNGSAWTDIIPQPTNALISSITTLGENMVVTGSFTNIAGVVANSIAQWNGSTWRSLDNGVQRRAEPGIVWDSAAAGGRLYVVGEFDKAGPNSSGNIAIWHQASVIHLTMEPGALNQLRITGGQGDHIQIEDSDNLATWNRLTDFTLPLSNVTATDPRPITTSTNRFYRARILEP